MRIVQSIKHTKRTVSKTIKEGWMVHFTNLDPQVTTQAIPKTNSELPRFNIITERKY